MPFIQATSTAALLLLFGAMEPSFAQQDQQRENQGKAGKQQGRRQDVAPSRTEQQPPQAQPQQRQEQRQAQPAPQPQQQQQRPQRQQQGVQQSSQQWAQEQQRQQREQESRQIQQSRQRDQQAQRAQQYGQQQQRTRQQATAWQQQRGWLRQDGGWQGQRSMQHSRAQNWDRDHRTWQQRGGYGGYYIPQDRFDRYFGYRNRFRINSTAMYMGYPRFSYGGYSFLLLDPWPEYWDQDWYKDDYLYVDYDEYDDGYYLYDSRHPYIRLSISVVL